VTCVVFGGHLEGGLWVRHGRGILEGVLDVDHEKSKGPLAAVSSVMLRFGNDPDPLTRRRREQCAVPSPHAGSMHRLFEQNAWMTLPWDLLAISIRTPPPSEAGVARFGR